MTYRLWNHDEPQQVIMLTHHAWQRLLELAEEHGWNPLGAVQPETWRRASAGFGILEYDALAWWERSYTPLTTQMVLWEDALNLADALERAFLAYEPTRQRRLNGGYWPEWDGRFERTDPGIGVILALVDFSRLGAFYVARI